MANMYRSNKAGASVLPTGNATAADVLTGKTFSNAVGIGIAGAMVNNGAVSGIATPSQPYTIPEGYHNGSGIVSSPPYSPTIDSYIAISVNDRSTNKKLYTALNECNVILHINCTYVSAVEAIGGDVSLYNQAGVKQRTIFNKPYGQGTKEENVIVDMIAGDYLLCENLVAQSTSGNVSIVATGFALS